MLPLRFHLSCGKRVTYRFIEFFVFDCCSLPYLFSLFYWLGVTFPLVALGNIMRIQSVMCREIKDLSKLEDLVKKKKKKKKSSHG